MERLINSSAKQARNITMKNIEMTKSTPTWDQVESDDLPIAEVHPMNIKRAIQYFSEIEDQCDAAIQEQDFIIRNVTRRLPEAVENLRTDANYVPLMLEPSLRAAPKVSDLAYSEFRQVAQLANKFVDHQMPMATKRFMHQAGPEEIEQIEQLEVDITMLRQRMRDVEILILNQPPVTADEVAMKLKFLAALMLDGGEIELDYFAYIVEESAEILEEALSNIRIV